MYRILLLLIVLLVATASAQPRTLTIAAASDLQGVLPEIARRFEGQTGLSTRLTFGSSGNFFAQVANGAPFDLFLSADIDYPRRLVRAGLGVESSLYHYADGQLVLWTLKERQTLLNAGLRGLTAPTVRRIAIANPVHAPYGRAAVAAFKSAGIDGQVQSKLVLGENISQAAQFVQSGNADVGIIARSIAVIPALAAAGTSVDIPAGSYPPIEQAAIVITDSKHQEAARQFLAFLKTPEIAGLMQQFGFLPPTMASR